MYEKYYGLTEKPFHVTPDPRFLFLSPHHREALACLRYGIQERVGFVAIIGEVGTGKTTLLRAVLNDLNPMTKTAFIFSTTITAKDLFRMMASDFGIETKEGTKAELLLAIHQFLLDQYSCGINCILIIDEAQNLSFGLLEEIRLLSNLETDREKLLQIILVGQPELDVKLAQPRLRQLRQRISSRYDIQPLNSQQTREYIQHRLRVAGLSEGSIFTSQAQEEIYRYSRGIPRVINMICDNALLLGYTYEKREIGSAILNESLADLKSSGMICSSSFKPPLSEENDTNGRLRRNFWRQRFFRAFAATSGLILGAAVLSLPLPNRGLKGVMASDVMHDRSVLRPSDHLPGPKTKRLLSCFAENTQSPHMGAVADEADVLPYSVQVASFRQKALADALVRTIQQQGYEIAFVRTYHLAGIGQWHRVMVGRYASKAAARQAANRFLSEDTFQYAIPWHIGAAQMSYRSEVVGS